MDVSPDQLMIEISGQERKIEAFINQVRSYEILELARTGRIALVRGDRREGDEAEVEAGRVPTADGAEPTVQGHSAL